MYTDTMKLYEGREDVTLSIYLTAGKGELRMLNPRPAVLIMPGGAYFSCGDREAEPIALQFLAQGYHAFVLRYSTYMEGQPGYPNLSEPLPVKEHTTHPTPVREVGMAIKLIHDHAEAWGVDPERIVVSGFSAGGHNAAMYCAYWNKPLITEYLNVDAAYIRPAAAVLGYPLTDYLYKKESGLNAAMKALFRKSDAAFLGTETPNDEQLLSVSPARLVSNDFPPMFIWATSTDEMVPVQHSLRLAHALSDHGVPYALHIFEKGEHGLSVATQASATISGQVNPDVARWVPMCCEWLNTRFAIALPEASSYVEMIAARRGRHELKVNDTI